MKVAVRPANAKKPNRPAPPNMPAPIPAFFPFTASSAFASSTSLRTSALVCSERSFTRSPTGWSRSSVCPFWSAILCSSSEKGFRLRYPGWTHANAERLPEKGVWIGRSGVGQVGRFDGQRGVRVRAPGADEGEQLEPVAALVQVQVGDDHGGLGAWRDDQLAPVRVGDERGAIEGERRLLADAIHGDHEDAVGNPVADDDLLPERLRVEVGVVGFRADRGRVDERVGVLEAVGARDLREPLVPARREAEAAVADVADRERLAVAGPRLEVAVLVVAGGDGDVQLARARGQLTVWPNDDRGVVAEPLRRLLVQRRVDVHAQLARETGRELVRGPTGQRLRLDADGLGSTGL